MIEKILNCRDIIDRLVGGKWRLAVRHGKRIYGTMAP